MGNLNKHHGIVLVAAMLMILMVSGIAVSVMSASIMNSKMVIATQEVYRAESAIRGNTELAIKNEIGQNENSQFFKKRSAYNGESITLSNTGQSQILVTNININTAMDLLDCPPSYSPTPHIKCNYLELTSSIAYGKNNLNTLVLKTGIEQEIMDD